MKMTPGRMGWSITAFRYNCATSYDIHSDESQKRGTSHYTAHCTTRYSTFAGLHVVHLKENNLPAD